MLTLKEWRRAKEISLEKMAGLIGVSMNTYIRWEREPKKMPIEKAFDCAKVLEVDFNDIIFLPEQDTKRVAETV